MTLLWRIADRIDQQISMKINEELAFSERFRIERAELYSFRELPRRKIWKDGTGKVQRMWRFPLWLKLWDQEGCCGEGPVTDGAVRIILPAMLSDQELRTNLEWRKIMYWMERARASFFPDMSAMELVLFDLIAGKRGLPVHRLLGAERNWTEIYKGGGSVLRSDEELLEEMLSVKEEGFSCTKIKIGLNDYKRDIRRLSMLRDALGPDFGIAVDANQAWDAEACMCFLREAHSLGIAWFEEPVVHTETEEIARLVRMMREEDVYVPLDYGESSNQFPICKSYIDAGVEMITVHPMQYCFAEYLRLADYARVRGCTVSSGQNYHPGVLAGAFLKPGELIEFHRPNYEDSEPYYSRKPVIRQGKAYLPEEPGLPVKADLEKLKRDGLLESIRYFTADTAGK